MYTHTQTPHTLTHTYTHIVTGSSASTLIRQEGLYVEEELTNCPHQYCIVRACLGHWPQRHRERRGWRRGGGGGGRQIKERARHGGQRGVNLQE